MKIIIYKLFVWQKEKLEKRQLEKDLLLKK